MTMSERVKVFLKKNPTREKYSREEFEQLTASEREYVVIEWTKRAPLPLNRPSDVFKEKL